MCKILLKIYGRVCHSELLSKEVDSELRRVPSLASVHACIIGSWESLGKFGYQSMALRETGS